ncbi:hypothetical protein [Anaerocolumna aminovalerica]|nr:hypothetical protein [Anaerocolumna aminovalerica]
MWQFVSGAGYDMLEVQRDLIELLESPRTYTDDWRTKLNNENKNKIQG